MADSEKYELENGEERHAANPKTFWIPSRQDRENIPVGTHAKLMFRAPDGRIERMWVEVTGRHEDGGYVGELDNEPVFVKLVWRDLVQFKPEHVINIDKFVSKATRSS